jgi:hypothetical protein
MFACSEYRGHHPSEQNISYRSVCTTKAIKESQDIILAETYNDHLHYKHQKQQEQEEMARRKNPKKAAPKEPTTKENVNDTEAFNIEAQADDDWENDDNKNIEFRSEDSTSKATAQSDTTANAVIVGNVPTLVDTSANGDGTSPTCLGCKLRRNSDRSSSRN